MEELNIRLQEIISHGQIIKGGYELVSSGICLGDQMVRVQMEFSFYHALQCASQQDFEKKSPFIITTLREWTTLKIQVSNYDDGPIMNVQMYIDLKSNMISLEAEHNIEGFDLMAARIISCFGIKKGNKVVYLVDVNQIKKKFERAPKMID